MTERIVEIRGERWQEVPMSASRSLWDKLLSRAEAGAGPWPQIEGHRMFRHPEEYGGILVDKVT